MRKNIFLAVGVLFMALTLHAQQYDTVCTMKNAFVVVMPNPFTDSRDGNVYKYVIIGNQVWMAENLKYLPSVVGPSTGSNTDPCYYVYDYDDTDESIAKIIPNYNTYGVLYNWPAAMNSETSSTVNPSGVQGVCPDGWHLPSDAEWTQLTDYLGGLTLAYGKLKETGTEHWNSPNTGATNETDFTALPGGYRLFSNTFMNVGLVGHWWSATEHDDSSALGRYMSNNNNNVLEGYTIKNSGFSVRCVKN